MDRNHLVRHIVHNPPHTMECIHCIHLEIGGLFSGCGTIIVQCKRNCMEVVEVKTHVECGMTWGLVRAHEFGIVNKQRVGR